jgi:hypothetical protein
LIRLCFSKRPDPLGCTQLTLNRAVFSLNQRSRTNLAIETPAEWSSGQCCVDPLRPPTEEDTEQEKCGEQVTYKKLSHSRDCNQSDHAASNERFRYSLTAHGTCMLSAGTPSVCDGCHERQ